MEQVLNQIIPILITALVSILVVIIKGVGEAVVEFIETKKEEVIAKIGKEKYDEQKNLASDVWNFVEEHFRVSETVGKVTEEKIAMFNEELKKRIPSLTDEQIELLRQSIAGQINAGKEVITSPAIVEEPKVETPEQAVPQETQDTIAELHNEEPVIEQPQV
jgi:Na+-transporting methylmalonyl-CoA/oxaloacetate decarboxylase gamma subunit